MSEHQPLGQVSRAWCRWRHRHLHAGTIEKAGFGHDMTLFSGAHLHAGSAEAGSDHAAEKNLRAVMLRVLRHFQGVWAFSHISQRS